MHLMYIMCIVVCITYISCVLRVLYDSLHIIEVFISHIYIIYIMWMFHILSVYYIITSDIINYIYYTSNTYVNAHNMLDL